MAVFGAYILLFMLMVTGGLFAAWVRTRHLRYRAVVQTLAVLVGQNLPLPHGLRAAARNERKALRRAYLVMAWRLEAGDRLSTALRSAMQSCPAYITGAIEGGEQGGTLVSVLRSLAADARRAPMLPATLSVATLYSLALLVILPMVLGFIFVVVVPKFRDIFADFNTQLPAMTEHLIKLGSPGPISTALVILLVIIALAVSQVSLARNFLVRMPGPLPWLPAALDSLTWRTPLAGRAANVRALTRQLPILLAAIRAGHDLPAAARQAACVDTNYCARRRLRRWARLLEAGAEPAAAARRLAFPAPFVRILATGGGAELATGLEYLAAYYRSLSVHWQRVVLSAMLPLIVLMWALCVGYIVVALFLPLMAIIDATAASIY